MNKSVIAPLVLEEIGQSNKLIFKLQSSLVLLSLLVELSLFVLADVFDADVLAELKENLIFDLKSINFSSAVKTCLPFRAQISTNPCAFVDQPFVLGFLRFPAEDTESFA